MEIKNQDFIWAWIMETFPNDYPHKHSWFLNLEQVKKIEFIDYQIPGGYGLRIFKFSDWQGTSFTDSAKIQNIFWLNDMAPRVREVIQISAPNKRYKFAHVVEYISEKGVDNVGLRELQLELLAENNFITIYQGDHEEVYNNLFNWRQNLYVDFGGFSINWDNYEEKITKDIIEFTHYGKSYNGAKASYQSIPTWGLNGKRKTDYRIDKLGLKEIDFKGKSVLDIGCNLGMMLHYASQNGAIKLTGYDFPRVVKVAKEVANFEGIFNLDLYGQDLIKYPPKEKADIVFYLAMSDYLGFPKWLPELTNELCLYEGHANEDAKETEAKLLTLFRGVRYLGISEDRSVRPLFYCYK